jgi:predicted nucleic acid-binding protein
MSERGARPRIVVDTNRFVSGTIFKRGNPFALLGARRDQAFVLLLSEDQHDELTDVVGWPQIVTVAEVLAVLDLSRAEGGVPS